MLCTLETTSYSSRSERRIGKQLGDDLQIIEIFKKIMKSNLALVVVLVLKSKGLYFYITVCRLVDTLLRCAISLESGVRKSSSKTTKRKEKKGLVCRRLEHCL